MTQKTRLGGEWTHLVHLMHAFLREVSRPHRRHRGVERHRGPDLAPSYCGRNRGWSGSWTGPKNGSRRVPAPGGLRWGISGFVGVDIYFSCLCQSVQWYWVGKKKKRKGCFKHDVKIRIKQLLVFGGATSVTNIKQNSPVWSRCFSGVYISICPPLLWRPLV